MRQIKITWHKTTLVALAVLFFTALAPPAQPVFAQNCRNLSVYTDWYSNKPAIYIWNGNVRPEPSKLTIQWWTGIYWETVPSPSDWGVRTDAPALEKKDGGWYVYYIATRWLILFRDRASNWNNDSRWQVRYCG